MSRTRFVFVAAVLIALFTGCAGAPVQEAVKVDLSLPVGKIEGNHFTGVRYPFNISAPPGWRIATEAPRFMEDLGYDKSGLDESQVFLFNPSTQSNLQIEFTPAGRGERFSQEKIENLTSVATGSLKEELEKDYGKEVDARIGPTTPYSLKGVPFAAKKYAAYTLKGTRREQGWIYAFSEPYQIFILYMVIEQKGSDDREALKKALDSFEVVPGK